MGESKGEDNTGRRRLSETWPASAFLLTLPILIFIYRPRMRVRMCLSFFSICVCARVCLCVCVCVCKAFWALTTTWHWRGNKTRRSQIINKQLRLLAAHAPHSHSPHLPLSSSPTLPNDRLPINERKEQANSDLQLAVVVVAIGKLTKLTT